jgi:hypothetical protein
MSELTPIGNVITPRQARVLAGKPALTPIQARLIRSAAESEDAETLYQHTVLCQTCLPYRDPGDDVRVWDRKNGNSIHLRVTAGELMDRKDCLVEQGLPFGSKSRVILMHLNQRAIVTQNPEIEVGESFTGFVCKVLGLDPAGRNLRVVKDQLNRLSAARITLGLANDEQAITDSIKIVRRMQLWGFAKDA